MKNLLVLFLLFIPLAAFCQTEEKQYYVYNIVSFEGSFTNIRIGGTVLNNPLLVKYDNTIWQYDATIYKYDW